MLSHLGVCDRCVIQSHQSRYADARGVLFFLQLLNTFGLFSHSSIPRRPSRSPLAMAAPEPFRIHVSDDDLTDLRQRLQRARVPDQVGAGQSDPNGAWARPS